MPKLRKLRKRQKFNYNRNRKRIQKTQEKTKNSNIKVSCKSMKTEWDSSKTIKQNLNKMGLAFDPNKVMPVKSLKNELIKKLNNVDEDNVEEEEEEILEKINVSKVVKNLEKEANSFEKRQTFRFPKDDVKWMTQMMDKHGDNFKKMAKDPKNIYQLTPKQIQHKIIKFLSIPEQFAPEARERGLLNDS